MLYEDMKPSKDLVEELIRLFSYFCLDRRPCQIAWRPKVTVRRRVVVSRSSSTVSGWPREEAEVTSVASWQLTLPSTVRNCPSSRRERSRAPALVFRTKPPISPALLAVPCRPRCRSEKTESSLPRPVLPQLGLSWNSCGRTVMIKVDSTPSSVARVMMVTSTNIGTVISPRPIARRIVVAPTVSPVLVKSAVRTTEFRAMRPKAIASGRVMALSRLRRRRNSRRGPRRKSNGSYPITR